MIKIIPQVFIIFCLFHPKCDLKTRGTTSEKIRSYSPVSERVGTQGETHK